MVLTAILQTWYQSVQKNKIAKEQAAKLAEVNTLVNGQKAALITEVAALKETIAGHVAAAVVSAAELLKAKALPPSVG